MGADLLTQEMFWPPTAALLASCNSTAGPGGNHILDFPPTPVLKTELPASADFPGISRAGLNIHLRAVQCSAFRQGGEGVPDQRSGGGGFEKESRGRENNTKQMVCSLEVGVHRPEKEVQT